VGANAQTLHQRISKTKMSTSDSKDMDTDMLHAVHLLLDLCNEETSVPTTYVIHEPN
jgi:hypothetical protein